MLDLLAYFLLRVFALFVSLLPLDTALNFGILLARVVHFFRTGKSIAYLNLKAAFEGVYSLSEIKEIAKRSLENFGRMAVEVLRIPLVDEVYYRRYCEILNTPRITEALGKGKGLIFLTPHFGNWELLHVICRYLGLPIKILIRDQKPNRLSDYFNKLRTSQNTEVIGRQSSIKGFIRALQQGSVVAITADQGSKSGLPVQFFGRTTLAPQGFIEIARRTGAAILPVFDVRENGNFHRVHVLPEIPMDHENGSKEETWKDLKNYYRILEEFIRRYPEQWLWDHKRWKYCFTKTVLALSDGKPGHESQSKAILEIFSDLQRENPSYEFRTRLVQIRFKSVWHRYLLNALAFFMLPWIRGRVEWLRPFLTEECFKTVSPIYADFVISCGSSLVPLNLLLSKENKARSIVLMKPSFPFQGCRYDLVIAPRHDEPVSNREVIYTDITPNLATEGMLKEEAEKLSARLGLNGKRTVSVFIGGDSKKYSMVQTSFEHALDRILGIVKDSNAQVLVTTSRRTSAELSQRVRQKLSSEKCCRLMVIANESNIANVTYGMIGVSDTIFVTEDSVSMISEAASSGKKVVILKVGKGKLPSKYVRFQKNLEEKQLARILSPDEITPECLEQSSSNLKGHPIEESRKAIKEKLQRML